VYLFGSRFFRPSLHSGPSVKVQWHVISAVDFLGFLQPDDGVGISFWIISITMVASTVFFGSEAQFWRPLEGLFARRYVRHFYRCGALLVHA